MSPSITHPAAETLRASIWFLAPLTARFGTATLPLPGGCNLNKGSRKVDLHFKILEDMGAQVATEGAVVSASAPPGGLRGAKIAFNYSSVGATITAILAGSVARGETLISGGALEPEVVGVCELLKNMGARIEGVGSPNLSIYGCPGGLGGARHRLMGDRIEGLTYAIFAAISRGQILLKGLDFALLENAVPCLEQAGLTVQATEAGIEVHSPAGPPNAVNVSTAPHPGFPTDLQPIFSALMCFIKRGASIVKETIYDNRSSHVPELRKMGAEIEISKCGKVMAIRPSKAANLFGANTRAHDLRGGAAVIAAALGAQGETTVENMLPIHRGYEGIVAKLAGLGASIKYVESVKA